MTVSDLDAIFGSLLAAEVRYLVVGGLAVIAHGYVRMTEDVDLVLDLNPGSISNALRALEALGYRPLVPVSLHDFAVPALREEWIENRHMKVFNLISDIFPGVTIDIFPREPFDFETEFASATWIEISPHLRIPVVSIPTLIAMKMEAGRDQDRIDVEKLRKLHGSQPPQK